MVKMGAEARSCTATASRPPARRPSHDHPWPYPALGAVLFAISLAGIFLNRKNVIVLLMAIELMLLSVNINFVAFSRYLGDRPARCSCSSS
jgi:hypothetical protein